MKLDENVEYYLLTLQSNPGVTPGEFGRILYGSPNDPLGWWGCSGGAALHRLKALGFAAHTTMMKKCRSRDYQWTRRTSVWTTTVEGRHLADFIRNEAKLHNPDGQPRAPAPAVSQPHAHAVP